MYIFFLKIWLLWWRSDEKVAVLSQKLQILKKKCFFVFFLQDVIK
jgi:hypothetical protein